MAFKRETTNMDLGDTLIENIFINDFMPMANGTYVKVYLLGYKYAYDKDETIDLSNFTISKHLNIPLSDVYEAWDFWEEKGIIKKIVHEDGEDYEVEFLNLKQLYIDNNYKPVEIDIKPSRERVKSGYDELIDANKNPSINKMFNNINDIVRRPLPPRDKKIILEWIYNYNMEPDIIERAFTVAYEKKGKRSVSYVAGIIRNWYDKGITNMEIYMDEMKNRNERFYNYDRILKSLGITGRMVSDGEKITIDKWFDEYNYSMDIIYEACKSTTAASNPSIGYLDGILKAWNKEGLKTKEDISSREIKRNEKKVNVSNKMNVKTKFHNFSQRTEDYSESDLEDIARNKRLEYFKKSKGEFS